MEENQKQIQKKSLSIKNLGTYLFKEIKKKHRLKLKGNNQMVFIIANILLCFVLWVF